ncbi:hypothetical protein, partial [Rhizobium sp. LjRoot30]|uniref:hypothetical protein n=1 Tax=Rhizobium sp. LjRoot30 TaxID=3342320 RepID=UPI003F4FDCA0
SFQGEVAAKISKRAETDLGLYTPTTVQSADVDAANLALGDIRTSMARQILSQANSLPQMAAALLRGRG